MKVTMPREALLRVIQQVSAGLSTRGGVQQSNCIAFRNGYAMTMNEETHVKTKSGLPTELIGAVRAGPLEEMLREMNEETVDLTTGKDMLIVKGTGRGVELSMEEEIGLPVEHVEKPGEWRPLPPQFLQAIDVIQRCAAESSKDDRYQMCLHIAPKWIEACDKTQFGRWRIKTGVENPFLVRRSSIKHAVTLGVADISETEGWVHFRNSSGLRLSCRIYREEFPDLSAVLDSQGVPTKLPKSLTDAAKKGAICSRENGDQNVLRVSIGKDKLLLEGHGVGSRYWEEKKVRYEGTPFAFLIAPEILRDVVERNPEVLLSEDRLMVTSGPYSWVTMLGAAPK
jgi:hypothetical protein